MNPQSAPRAQVGAREAEDKAARHRARRTALLLGTTLAGLLCLVLLQLPEAGERWGAWLPRVWPSWWGGQSNGAAAPAARGPETPLAVAAILEQPDAFAGQRVVIGGEISRLVGQRGFVIGGDDFVDAGELLVLRRPDTDRTAQGAAVDDLVQVAGTVMRLDPPAVGRALGRPVNEALLRPWRGGPVLIADTVALTARVPGALIEEVARDPARFEGRVVRVEGALRRLAGDYGFTLAPPGGAGGAGGSGGSGGSGGPAAPTAEVLVVAAVPPWLLPGWPDWPASATDVAVTATGVVRRFDLQAVERELGVDLDDDAFAPYAGAPAVVARSATLPPGPPLRSRTPDG